MRTELEVMFAHPVRRLPQPGIIPYTHVVESWRLEEAHNVKLTLN